MLKMLSKLKARYERRNLAAIFFMAFMDAMGWLLSRMVPIDDRNDTKIQKILLVNPAHIGDVVISTAAIRRIKEWDSSIQIGFVTGSWARMVLDGHPGIDHLYVVDHWRLNRSNKSRYQKIATYFSTWWAARRALREAGYDLGVLLNSFSPNLSSLLWTSSIPTRVGYVSAGMTTLLNVVYDKPDSHKSEQSIQLQLLERVGITGGSAAWLNVVPLTEARRRVLGIDRVYVVLHPGTGNAAKAWPVDRWQEVINALDGREWVIGITGHGYAEQELAVEISKSSQAVNLVGKLTWDEWVAVLAEALVVIGVDSAVGHVSAAIGARFVGIYSGIGVVARWAPSGNGLRVLTKQMLCSPCHTKPCIERQCIMSVSAQDVLAAVYELLRAKDARIL